MWKTIDVLSRAGGKRKQGKNSFGWVTAGEFGPMPGKKSV